MKMPFGKYRGQEINDLAQSDEGLLYLDWLRGERKSDQRRKVDPLDKAICEVLDDEDNAEALQAAMDERDDYRWGTCAEDHF